MEPTANDSTILILGHSLWADTTQPPQPGHGLAVSGGRILAVGPHEELGARFPEAQVVDAGDCVITPAFTNAHHHMYGVLAHGIPRPARRPAGPGAGRLLALPGGVLVAPRRGPARPTS